MGGKKTHKKVFFTYLERRKKKFSPRECFVMYKQNALIYMKLPRQKVNIWLCDDGYISDDDRFVQLTQMLISNRRYFPNEIYLPFTIALHCMLETTTSTTHEPIVFYSKRNVCLIELREEERRGVMTAGCCLRCRVDKPG